MTKEQAINDLEERAKALNRIIKVCEEAKCPVWQYREMEEMKGAIETVLSMLKEKDKRIDLMAEAMRYYNGMQQKQEFCIDICEEKECNIEKCKERIKQYFENKAKENPH